MTKDFAHLSRAVKDFKEHYKHEIEKIKHQMDLKAEKEMLLENQ